MDSQPILNNQLFGCLSASAGSLQDAIRIDGTESIECSKSRVDGWQLQLLGTPETKVLSGSSPEHGAFAYVWGTVAHPDIQTPQIPAWVARVASEQHYERLKELLGYFVIIVAEPRQRRLSLVSDILGARPLFYRLETRRLIFGSDAWALQRAGLTSGEIDWDAVSSWILYSCNYTGKTLFADLQRLDAGSVAIFENGRHRDISYVRFPVSNQSLSPQQAAEQIHAIVKPVCKTILSRHKTINIALSGGYDSRYLLAMALEANAGIDKVATVGYPKEEGQIAAQVASALDVPLETQPVEGAVWDIYDDVFHFMPDGFPITKHVSYCLPHCHPRVPVVNGYLGGPLLRAYELKGFKEPTGPVDWPNILLEKNALVERIRLGRWFGEVLTHRILQRARNPMAVAVEKGSYTGKLLSWADLYYVQGRYLANNFVQHLHLAEALLPLYSYSLLAFKFEHHPNVLNREVYLNIFRSNFPKLATIPHSSDLEAANAARGNSSFLARLIHRPVVARCTAKWARQLALAMAHPHTVPVLRKERTIPIALASTSSLMQASSRRLAESAEVAVFNFKRFYLLEKRCHDAGLDFDWRSL